MNALIEGSDLASRVSFVKWIWRKHMIMRIGNFIVFVEAVWLWKKMVLMDSPLFLISALFSFGKRHFDRLL
jgi:hypothetical protein